MSSSLQNCTITSYSAEEFAGDNMSAGTLEAQTLPSGTGYTSSQAQTVYSYFLKISPLPNYRINSNMVFLNSISPANIGALSPLETSVRSWQMNSNTTGAAISQYQGTLNQVRIYDTLTDGDTNCNNEIIVMVQLDPGFTMPSNDVYINLDFGCTAAPCQEEEVWTPTNNSIGLQFFELIINSNYENCDIFVAKYFDDAAYASSIYWLQNRNCFNDEDDLYAYRNIPVYDPNFLWLNNNPGYFVGSPDPQQDSPLASFQPTTYNQYSGSATFEDGNTWSGWFDVNNTNNVTTECGSILCLIPPRATGSNGMDLNASANITLTQGTIGPNAESNPVAHDLQRNEGYRIAAWSGEGGAGSIPYLNPTDYPFLTPGDGVLPTHLQWYISVGDNPDYELIAETADIWKIISTSAAGSDNDPSTDSLDVNNWLMSCSVIMPENYTLLVSETNTSGVVTQNNSYLDIANAEITQVIKPDGSIDTKTIKVKIPFQSNLEIPFWQAASSIADDLAGLIKNNKIFLNLYPTEV
jgi:hypothetical protein